MTEKNELEELPFCECGCGERVSKVGNKFVNGHNSSMKGKIGWNKGLTKNTNSSVKSQSEKMNGHIGWNKGLTKEIHEGVRSHAEKITGRTKETHDGVRRQSEKIRGRTKENNEGIKRTSEKLKGRNKENNEGIKRMAEKLKKRTGELSAAWKGGISFLPYCDKFNENLKERVRDYFGRCCYLCGKNENDNGQKLDVHHVNYQKMACCEKEIRPLFVPLCMNCHRKTYGDREEWEELFTVSLDYLTDGECFIHKTEEMEGEMIK
jgi:NTP pyrophosphatase (non-canonical NTP hydrolase)